MKNKNENLYSALDVYLSLLNITPNTKRIHKEAISNFFCLLSLCGRNTPMKDDYDDFRYYLLFEQKRSISAVNNAISCVQRFFSWLAENPECVSTETVKTLPEQKHRKRGRRVTTYLNATQYEHLKSLAELDATEIPTILNMLVMKYVAYRKADIERVKGIEAP